jgi:hypothetical protein
MSAWTPVEENGSFNTPATTVQKRLVFPSRRKKGNER